MRYLLKALFLAFALFSIECSAQSSSGIKDGYSYVDLGLPSGTKWAVHNVGATSPIQYGDYFAWGETTPKENYSWSTYKWCTVDENNKYDKFTKYVITGDYGIVDSLTVLEPADDAATANWGGAWRMPTKAEQDELRNGCDWTFVEDFSFYSVPGF